MRKKIFYRKLLSTILCLLFFNSNVFALNAATDLINHTSGVNPTTNGNITNITTTHAIDTYHWSSFNLSKPETANFIFGNNGQTALNYLSPGANPSTIYGSIMSSGAKGNILLFNPNGIMMGAGASVSGANSFFASTNKFDGIVDGKVKFSEAEKNNPLTIGNIKFNNVNNAHFVAPNVIIKADNITTNNTVSFRAIGGGEYDVNTNIFSNEIGVKAPIADTNTLDVNANVASNKITIEAKNDSETYATAMISGDIKANKAVTGENGEIYIIASNDSSSTSARSEILQNAIITGESATVNLNADRICLNGDIDVSGTTGGTVNINTKSLDQNSNIIAKGTTGDGGTVNIKTVDYVAVKDATIDVSSTNGKGGTIDLEGDYQILSSGTYKADSVTGDGGKIKISAPLTKLLGVKVDASGGHNGGEIYIGGSSKSTEPIQKSYLTLFSDASVAKADGGNGTGGKIHFDSENTTYVFGSVSAKNGGYVEISAKETLGSVSNNIETGGGTLFIDPKNIIISDSGIGGIVYDNLLTNGSSLFPSGTLSLTSNSYFGGSTAIYNNLFAVGAPGLLGGTTGNEKGAVYLFSFDGTWTNIVLNQKISQGSIIGAYTFNLEDGANFGSAVALGNNLLAIGSSGDSDDKARAGGLYLLSFTSTVPAPYGSMVMNLKIDSKPTSPIVLGLQSGNRFGSAVAMCPSSLAGTNLLAVGAYGDSTVSGGAGATYLLSFLSTTPYNSLTPRYKLDASTTTPVNLTGLAANDKFGSALGLTSTLLTIGAMGDSTGGKAGAGAAYLMSFNTSSASTPYNNLTIRYKLDSSTTTPVNLTSLLAGDNFGSSMALKDGTLLIGAKGDDTGGANRGAEYIYNFTSGSNTYAGLNLSTKLASGSIILDSVGNPYTLTLLDNSAFGSASAIYNDLFSVGASGYTPAGTNYGASYLFNFIGNQIAAYTFSAYPSATLYLSPTTLASWLTSSNVTLQANNDIIFRSLVAGTGGAGNALTLQAGRSINVETGISVNLGSADLFATANETLAAGVVNAYRDAGAAEINMATGSSITTAGNVTLRNQTGTGKTFTTSGDITVNNISANTINLYNQGLTVGSDVILNGTLLSSNAATTSNITATGGINFQNTTGGDFNGNLSMTATGNAITQIGTGSGLRVAGTTNITAGANNVSLTNTSNDFIGAVSIVSANNASASDKNDLLMGTSNVNNDLTLTAGNTSGGNITQVGVSSITVGNNTNLYTPASVTLNQAGNNFNAASATGQMYIRGLTVGSSATNATIRDINALRMGDVKLSNTFALTAGGDITQCAPTSLAIGGTTSLTAGANNITLNNATNDFSGAVSIASANNADIRDTNALIINNSSITNDLTLTAGGNITQVGGSSITVGNNTNLYTPASVTLNESGNNFNATSPTGQMNIRGLTVGSTATNAKIRDTSALRMGNLGLSSNMTLTASGDITQGVGTTIAVSGASSLTAGVNNINLNNSTNDFTGTVSVVSANNADIRDTNALIMNNSNITNDLTLTAGGNITQVGGSSITVGNNTNLYTPASVTLNESGNNFNATSATGQIYIRGLTVGSAATNATIRDINAIQMGDVSLSNNLALTAGGNITQCAPTSLAIAGTTTLTAGANNIALNNTANNFVGAVSIASASNADIRDTNALLINNSSVTNDLTLTAGGNITQVGGSSITVGNNTNLYTPASITLNESGNNFNATSATGQMYIRGLTVGSAATNATIRDINDLRMGDVNLSNDLTLNAGSDITQCAGTAIKVGNNTRLNAPGNIILDRIWNDFNNASPTGQLYINDAIAAATNATIVDSNNLRMGNANVSNNLILTAKVGDITQCAGTAIKVGNNTDLNSKGTITLANANNDFGQNGTGQVKISSLADPAVNATVRDINALRMGNVNISNNMTLTAGGNMTQGIGTTIAVGGVSSLTAGTNTITFNNATNDFTGAISIVSASNADIRDTNTLIVDNSSITNDLTLTAGGNITQIGGSSITVGNNTNLYTPASITLNESGNNFNATSATGQMYIRGLTVGSAATNATIRDINAIQMGDVSLSNNLALTAGGNITQCAPTSLAIAGTTTLTAGANNITLNNAANNFVGAVSIASASNADIRDTNALLMNNSSVSNDLTLTAGGNITQVGGSIITVGNNTNLYTPASVTLNESGNNFNATSATGQMYIRGLTAGSAATNATIRDTNALRMGDVNVSNDLTLTAGGDITQCAGTSILVGNNATFITPGDVILDQPGNNFGYNGGLAQLYIGSIGFPVTNAIIFKTGDLNMGDSYVSNDLTLAATGNINQCAGTVINVGNNTNLYTPGTITLNNTGNNFNSSNPLGQLYIRGLTVGSAATNADIRDTDSLQMGDTNVSNNLTLTAATDITQCVGTSILSGGTVGSLTTLTSTSGGNIYLNEDTNDFKSPVLVSTSENANIHDRNSLEMGTSSVTGNLTLQAFNDITQTAGSTIMAGGTASTKTTLTSTSGGNIYLDEDTNDFKNSVWISTGGDAWIHDRNDLTMGTVNTGTDLILVAGAGVGNSGSIVMDTTSVGNNMTLTATGGSISQNTASGHAVTINGTSNLTSGTGSSNYIAFDNHENDFKDTVSSNSGGDTTIYDANNLTTVTVSTGTYLTLAAGWSGAGDLSMDTTSVGTNMDLSANGGNITQNTATGHAITMTNAAGTTNLVATTGAAGTGNIDLSNVENDFTGAVTSNSGGYTTISDANNLTMGPATSNGTMTLSAGNSLLLNDNVVTNNGDLIATANNLDHTTGAAEILMASGKSINAGTGNVNITLEAGTAPNNTSGDITLNDVTGNNLVIRNKGTTTGSDIIITGALSATGSAKLDGTNNISIANPSTAYGGFTMQAIGNVTTDDLTTTDGTLTHPGADVIIEAYSPTTPVPDTFITTKNITAGIGNINISLYEYLSPNVGSITIDGNMSGNFIKLLNSGSTGHSNIIVNGAITATASGSDPQRGIVDLNAQDDITLNSPAFADTGFDIYGAYMKTKNLTTNNYVNMTGYDIDVAGAIDAGGKAILGANDIKIEADSTANTGFQLLANHSVKTENLTTVNSDVEIQGNIGTASVPPSTIDVGNITAGSGDATITMFDNLPNPGAITVKDITSKNIDIQNNGASTASSVVINGTLTATGDAILKATGDITQNASSGGIIIDGTTDLKSDNNITLEKATNDFVGAVTIEGANNASLRDANSFIFGPVTTNGDLTVYANSRTTGGATANISMDPGATINSGGNVDIRMLDNPDAGTISVNSIDGNKILVWDQSLLAGTNVLINSGATLSSHSLIDANPLIVSSDGGNFINNAGAGALSVDADRWLVYTGSPADTTLGGLVPVNTFCSSTIYTHPPSTVTAGDSVLYRTPNPNPTPTPGGGGGGGGAIAGGVVGGVAAAGGAATASGLGLLPGLLLGLASPLQFNECMLDIIDQSQSSYPLLVRNMQYVFQTCDISKLDPCKIGSTIFIPDSNIQNGSFELVKVQIPTQFANAPKGITVRVTQKSGPFGISKNIPEMNFNVFNTLSDKQINSMYATRRFLKPNYVTKRITPLQANSQIEANNGIIQKTVFVGPNETVNNLSIAVNYLKNGQFPRKNSPLKLQKQAYSLVIQFIENQ